MSVEKPAGNGTFGVLYCAIFRTPSLADTFRAFWETLVKSMQAGWIKYIMMSWTFEVFVISVGFNNCCISYLLPTNARLSRAA